MFEYLYGVVEYKKMDYVALDINGVGYKIYISLREYEKIEVGEKYKFFIYNQVKEDANNLIGFTEERDRKLGEKKAQLIILELKNKLKNIDYVEEKSVSADMLQDMILALEGLGYTKKEIDSILSKVDLKQFSTIEEAIKGILKNIKIGE